MAFIFWRVLVAVLLYKLLCLVLQQGQAVRYKRSLNSAKN